MTNSSVTSEVFLILDARWPQLDSYNLLIYSYCSLRVSGFFFSFSPPRTIRLLDASVVPSGSYLDFTLVLEYIDQDLSTYLSKVPASGLSRDSIKV